MKRVKIGLLATAAFFSTSLLQAQTVDEVIVKHIEAIGGKEKISQIKSIYMEGSMSVMGNEAPTVTYLLNGKGYKSEVDFNGQKIIQAYNETGGWSINPMMGSTSPQPIPDEQYKSSREDIQVGGPLLDYAAKGHKAELLGKDGNAFKVKIVTKDSAEVTYFIDGSNYYMTKMIRKVNMAGQEGEIEANFSDYRKTDFGYVLPYKTEMNLPGITLSTTVNKVEINKEIDPKIFEMPSGN